MTVAELIEKLKNYNPESLVLAPGDEWFWQPARVGDATAMLNPADDAYDFEYILVDDEVQQRYPDVAQVPVVIFRA